MKQALEKLIQEKDFDSLEPRLKQRLVSCSDDVRNEALYKFLDKDNEWKNKQQRIFTGLTPKSYSESSQQQCFSPVQLSTAINTFCYENPNHPLSRSLALKAVVLDKHISKLQA